MGELLNRLKEKKILVSDGAWGTMLQSKGLKPGACLEEWNITHPVQVKSVAASYALEGSDMVLTNTFGGSSSALEKYNFQGRVSEFNEAGARLSLEGAPECIVAGSIGPTGEFLAPLGTKTEEEMEAVYLEQISAILEAGVRVICVETMISVEEAACAVRAAKSLDASIDVIATMTFDPAPHGFRTMMGVDCRKAVDELTKAGADILGSNCGNGIEQMVPIAKEFHQLTDKPILIHANAGLPEIVGGETVYRLAPEKMAYRVKDLIEAGATIIGGCCGTTQKHIAAIKRAVDQLVSSL